MPNIVIKIEVFSEIDDLFANYVIKYKKKMNRIQKIDTTIGNLKKQLCNKVVRVYTL